MSSVLFESLKVDYSYSRYKIGSEEMNSTMMEGSNS